MYVFVYVNSSLHQCRVHVEFQFSKKAATMSKETDTYEKRPINLKTPLSVKIQVSETFACHYTPTLDGTHINTYNIFGYFFFQNKLFSDFVNNIW